MQTNQKKADTRAIALALVAQVERQAQEIAQVFSRAGMSDRFGDFHDLLEKLDQFQVFIDLVESHLGDFEPEKQEAQAKNLAQVRWGILQLEIEATRAFLARMADSGKPWPLGSKPALARRLQRLDEIRAFHAENAGRFALSALDAPRLQALGDALKEQVGHSVELTDFTKHAALAFDDFAAAPMPHEPAPSAAPRHPPAARPVPATTPAQKAALHVRVDDGNYYVDQNGLAVVNEACKTAQISIDDLAGRLEVSRPALVLMLNGRDPIALPALNRLRSFVSRHGGRVA
ncbi:hypothetical protein [Ferrovibrio sp.]|uniref:hypothetical protein n=1 Tax=Ferrovibrio sp. TaxID=1917215 RepID=UPI00262B336E|nr:hypothetical protein [Ferrovibrio sp.]